jgi:release factor glutamine methyltransferase
LTVTWRRLLDQARNTVGSRTDASRIVEKASGYDGAELWERLDDPAPDRAAAFVGKMAARRAEGEPLQYVIGGWGFRRLDLFLDRRVLIPRPETETVVELALAELKGLGEGRRRLAVDLGTGSGAIALSLVVEAPRMSVWATDSSEEALAVARANLAGAGSPATRVRLVQGRWWSALPSELAGTVDLAVSNPPYVAESEEVQLPDEVARWEPRQALVAGPDGTEALAEIVGGAPQWLARPGRLVVEIAPHQADTARALATDAGFTEVEVHPDLTGRLRVLVARI